MIRIEYKSELIDFEKEDMESKKRMLGSDKVNIVEIKERLEDVRKENVNTGFQMDAEHEFNTHAESDIAYLLSLLEQAEKALKRLQSKAYLVGNTVMLHEINVEIEALQAIRK